MLPIMIRTVFSRLLACYNIAMVHFFVLLASLYTVTRYRLALLVCYVAVVVAVILATNCSRLLVSNLLIISYELRHAAGGR